MAFSLSSSTITQTGTDSDLSGLAAITGVTYSVINGSGTMPNRKVYDLASLRLNIEGTLSHDPSKEVLIFKGGNNNNERIFIEAGAVYNYGTETTFQGGTHYTTGEGLIIRSYYTGSQRQWRPETAGMQIRGDFNWKGGTIVSGRSIIAETTGTITVRDGIFKPWATSLSQKDYCPRIGLDGADADIDGLEVYGYNGHFFGFALSSDVLTNFTNISIQGTTDYSAAIAGDSTTSGSGQPHAQIKNIPSLANGNLYSGRAWQNRVNVWTNYGGGANLKDELSDTTNTIAASKGLVIAQKEVFPTIVGTDGLPIQDVKVLVKEESDGNEATSTQLGAYSASDITHYSSARNQIETTNASGQTNTITSGLVLCYKFDRYDPMAYNVKTISGTNEQTSRQFGYDYLLNEGRLDMSGTGVLQPTFTMIQDINVTATKVVADAYTELNNAAQVYDRAKSYLYDNWAGEGALIVGRSGAQVDIGSTNLNIDATATSAFAYSTDVTIKSSTFTGGAVGTGTVTVRNGSLLDGGTFNAPVVYQSGAGIIEGVTADSIDFTQSGTYNLVGTNIGTVTNSSGGAITITVDSNSSVTTNGNPSTITLQLPQASISITNIESGSRIRIYNETTSSEIYNGIVNSTTYTSSYANGSTITTGDIIKVRLTYQVGTSAKLGYEATAQAGSNGFSVLADQQDDEIYNAIGVDGSLVTEFSNDFVNNEIDIVVAANFSAHRLYARYIHFLTLEDGIRLFFGAVTAIDLANFRNNVNVLDMYFNNNTSSNLYQTDNVRLFKSNGAYPARTNTTGGGGLDVVWRNTILIAETGVSGLTAQESAKLNELDKLESIDKLTKLIPASL